MKTKFFAATFAVLLLASCKDDDDKKTYSEENPLVTYMESSGFNQKTANFINAGSYEFGYRFQPKVKGTINAITFKIPDNATNTRVTIWNAETKVVLRTITIPTSTANTELRLAIDPLSIEPSEKYAITYNGNDWYKRYKTDNSVTTYPINAGNISILGYNWLGTASQTFPTNVSADYYGGDLSIVFQQKD